MKTTSPNVEQRLNDFAEMRDLGLIQKQGDFYPSVHYPPITMYPEITEDELFAGYTLPSDGLFDVYVHIPFCLTRCLFCHYPLKLGKEQGPEKDKYLSSLDKEMALYCKRLGVDRIRARSILVGGGTPTFLTCEQMQRFFKSLHLHVDIPEGTQFSYDVDPNTLLGEEGRERMQIMKDNGVNRLTIGLQSLDDNILRLMNRHHNAEQAIESIKVSQDMGFQVNIEFIFGYPGQTLEGWNKVVEKAVTLNVEEIQFYRLKVEAYGDHQGPIKNIKEKHPEKVPTNEEAIMMKQAAIDILAQHGYHENLRRVFTRKPEHYSHYAHNQCCMLYDEVGFGLTAFSSLRDRFALNTQDFQEYYALIESGKLPINRGLVRSREEQLRWAIVLPLKNRTVRKRDYLRATGEPLEGKFAEKFALLKKYGLVEENEKEIGLTKLGCFFADEVAQQFHSPDFVPFPESSYEMGPLSPFKNIAP
ncbi:MAG: coproporphyrinogen-III oxidase family protein [Methylococcales bacterium]